jgi:citrate lyase subunit beta/citryl-CoA lyase
MVHTAGNEGTSVRSDCFVSLEIKDSGGIQISIKSKVKTMYGASIQKLTEQVLQFFGIQNCELIIDDKGALTFVLMARIEAAIKLAVVSDKEYLPEFHENNSYSTNKDRFRFSRLYLPGNNPVFMINAGIHQPDGIILDLEDSVAPSKKYEARFLVRNALRSVDYYGAERMVRINQFPAGIEDLVYIIPHYCNLVLVPKCEGANQIIAIEHEIQRIKDFYKLDYPVWLMPIIESAMGVEKAFEIAASSHNIVALAIGLEDFTADLGTRRTKEGTESFFARTRLVNACKAAGIQAIDSVFSDIGDIEGLIRNVEISKSLGFEGMGCIHPRQIPVIHAGFAPEADEIEKAKKIVNAFISASEKGLGVVSLGSKMIDPPVVKRAEKTIKLAISLGLISNDWRNEYVS